MAFAGGDVMRVTDKHHKRIRRRGAFTAPGDGSLDLETILQKLADYGYEGWFVVEAGQDPVKAPAKYAKIGYRALTKALTKAGYKIEGQSS